MKTKELYTQDHTIDLSSDREPQYDRDTRKMHELQEKWEQVYRRVKRLLRGSDPAPF